MPDENWIAVELRYLFSEFSARVGQPIVEYDDNDEPIFTDEQRAEFLAHVAHTIGYSPFYLNGRLDHGRAFFDAYRHQSEQRDRDSGDDHPTG